MSKKTIIIIILAVLILGLAWGAVYYIYFVKRPAENSQNNNSIQNSGFPEVIESPNIIQESNNDAQAFDTADVFASALSADGAKILYFEKFSGNLFSADFLGSGKEKMSAADAPDLLKARWSNDKTRVILSFPTEEGVANILYDLTKQKTTPLDAEITDFVFGPKDNRFVFARDGQVYLSDADYKKPSLIYSGRILNAMLSWPEASTVYIITPASEYVPGALLSLNIKNGALKKILEAPALIINPSLDGKKLLYSSRNSLFLADNAGKGLMPLPFSTLASKCVFAANMVNLYCAVPKSMPSNFVIDDYYKGLIDFDDEFKKVNLKTNDVSNIQAPEGNFDAQNLIISPKEDYLMFVNRKDGKLYSIKI